MSVISERVSYLKGLAEGLNIDASSSEGKLLLGIINVLGEIADDIDYLEESQDEVFDRVYDLEDEVYVEDYDADDDEEYDFYDDEDEDEEFSLKCPGCGNEFFIDTDDLDSDDDIVCPSCGETIEFEFGCGCDDCDCDDC